MSTPVSSFKAESKSLRRNTNTVSIPHFRFFVFLFHINKYILYKIAKQFESEEKRGSLKQKKLLSSVHFGKPCLFLDIYQNLPSEMSKLRKQNNNHYFLFSWTEHNENEKDADRGMNLCVCLHMKKNFFVQDSSISTTPLANPTLLLLRIF